MDQLEVILVGQSAQSRQGQIRISEPLPDLLQEALDRQALRSAPIRTLVSRISPNAPVPIAGAGA